MRSWQRARGGRTAAAGAGLGDEDQADHRSAGVGAGGLRGRAGLRARADPPAGTEPGGAGVDQRRRARDRRSAPPRSSGCTCVSRARRSRAWSVRRWRWRRSWRSRRASSAAFPPPAPPARDGWRFAAQLQQAGHIGGDFYDFVDRGESLLVLLADVSRQGHPGGAHHGIVAHAVPPDRARDRIGRRSSWAGSDARCTRAWRDALRHLLPGARGLHDHARWPGSTRGTRRPWS